MFVRYGPVQEIMTTASSPNLQKQRFLFNFYELLQNWWRHRISFLISVAITLAALALYFFTFLGERPTAIFEFIQRFELDALDTRFRYRPPKYAHPDDRIVVVDIDQRAQEALGRWPFSRTYLAKMLNVLHDEGASVVGFDITFSKPDLSAAPIRELDTRLQDRAKRGEPVDPKILAEVQKLKTAYDADTQFASSIHNFGPVILGNFMLYTEDDLNGLDGPTLDAYADQMSFFAYPPAQPINPATQKQDKLKMLDVFATFKFQAQGVESNMDKFTSALAGDFSWTGYFNAPPDPDGVVRKATLVLPYGRSKDLQKWDLYPSLDLMTARAFIGPPAMDARLIYGPQGIVEIRLGDAIVLHPDGKAQMPIDYQGPKGTYHHCSIVDVIQRSFKECGSFQGKIVLVGATATGIGDLKGTPYGGTDYPGVEIHANVIDNILNQKFLKHGLEQALVDLLLIVFVGIPVGILLALVSPRWMWFGIALLLPIVGVNFWAFLHGWWLNLLVPSTTLTLNVLLVSLYRALIEEKEKRRVRNAFGQYLSPEVIRRLLLNPQLVEPR
jgi:adenylate cyclase